MFWLFLVALLAAITALAYWRINHQEPEVTDVDQSRLRTYATRETKDGVDEDDTLAGSKGMPDSDTTLSAQKAGSPVRKKTSSGKRKRSKSRSGKASKTETSGQNGKGTTGVAKKTKNVPEQGTPVPDGTQREEIHDQEVTGSEDVSAATRSHSSRKSSKRRRSRQRKRRQREKSARENKEGAPVAQSPSLPNQPEWVTPTSATPNVDTNAPGTAATDNQEPRSILSEGKKKRSKRSKRSKSGARSSRSRRSTRPNDGTNTNT